MAMAMFLSISCPVLRCECCCFDSLKYLLRQGWRIGEQRLHREGWHGRIARERVLKRSPQSIGSTNDSDHGDQLAITSQAPSVWFPCRGGGTHIHHLHRAPLVQYLWKWANTIPRARGRGRGRRRLHPGCRAGPLGLRLGGGGVGREVFLNKGWCECHGGWLRQGRMGRVHRVRHAGWCRRIRHRRCGMRVENRGTHTLFSTRCAQSNVLLFVHLALAHGTRHVIRLLAFRAPTAESGSETPASTATSLPPTDDLFLYIHKLIAIVVVHHRGEDCTFLVDVLGLSIRQERPNDEALNNCVSLNIT
mmetsp:Transcript_279/g.527  ORF Transcript_279/g.527 Transcript_279/m.527 type:complete len:305 (-) Transcript_279:1785-2699(-)